MTDTSFKVNNNIPASLFQQALNNAGLGNLDIIETEFKITNELVTGTKVNLLQLNIGDNILFAGACFADSCSVSGGTLFLTIGTSLTNNGLSTFDLLNASGGFFAQNTSFVISKNLTIINSSSGTFINVIPSYVAPLTLTDSATVKVVLVVLRA